MKKRILSLVMCLCLAATLLPGTAWAAGEEQVDASVITLDLNSGDVITLNRTTPYYVNGETTAKPAEGEAVPENWNAKFEPATENEPATLTLKGLDIEGSVKTLGNLLIVLDGDSEITNAAADAFSTKDSLYYTTSVTLSGTGTLKCESAGGNGVMLPRGEVVIERGAKLVAKGGDLPLEEDTESCGIYCSGMTILGGEVDAKGGVAKQSYGIYCRLDLNNITREKSIIVQGGSVTAAGGDLRLEPSEDTVSWIDSYGIWSQGIEISENATLNATGGSVAGYSAFSYGIYNENVNGPRPLVVDSGSVTATGGPAHINSDNTASDNTSIITPTGRSFGICCNNAAIDVNGGEVKGVGGKATYVGNNADNAYSCGIQSSGSKSSIIAVRDGKLIGSGNNETHRWSDGISGYEMYVSGGEVVGTGGAFGIWITKDFTISGGTASGSIVGTPVTEEDYGVEIGGILTTYGGTLKGNGNDYGIRIMGDISAKIDIKGGIIEGQASGQTGRGIYANKISIADSSKYKTIENGTFTEVTDAVDDTNAALENCPAYLRIEYTGRVPAHEHVEAASWSKNETKHWHWCYICEEKMSEAEHSFDSGVVIKPATATETGKKTFTCRECKYTKTEVIPATGSGNPEHTHDNWDSYWTADATKHWHKCLETDCTEKKDEGVHIYDNDQDTICNTCGYTRTIGGGSGDSGSSRPSGGGSSGGTTTSKPVTNPDGSITTTTENKTTGTVAETTKAPDGSQKVVATQKDGTVTTTATDKDGNKTETVAKTDGSSVTKVEQKDGTTANVTIDASGKTQAEVKVPAAVAQAAQQSGEALALPIPAVQARTVRADAPAVTVSTGSSTPVKVEIPTANPTPGTVAVLVNANGTEEVIKTSLPTDGGVAVSLPDGATVKIVDNSKTFADVPAENWAADAVRFSSARELFGGTGENSFSPNAPMTRAMMVTVLARFDGADTNGGDTWYEKGVDWAVEKGISDGSAPESSVTREQLAVMLWRYAGSPAPAGSLEGFSDAESVSDYAQEAMRWAVENGIVNGFGDGQLGPQGQATRAQVAQMLKNFIEKA